VRQHVPQARQTLKKVPAEALIFAPVTDANSRHYRFEGKVTFGKLVEGLTLPMAMASPTGLAYFPVAWPSWVVGRAA
jgi:hypothetical protein